VRDRHTKSLANISVVVMNVVAVRRRGSKKKGFLSSSAFFVLLTMTNALSLLVSHSARRSGGTRMAKQASSYGSRIFAQAFTASSRTASTRSSSSRLLSAGAASSFLLPDQKAVLLDRSTLQQQRSCGSTSRLYLSTTTPASASSTEVDEDLDAALDDILGEAFSEVDTVPAASNGDRRQRHHMEGSRPMPKQLVEQDDVVNYKDPKFLSTSNPRWVDVVGLSQQVLDVLSNKGITQFTPVQAEAFEPVLARRDVIGRSRTGTGKTLAFGLPSLTRLVDFTVANGKRDPKSGRMRRGRLPSMLVLCPTRELARQVQEELGEVAKPLNLFVDVFHGGVSYGPQAGTLRNGVDVIVGTPGRIIDHLERGNLNLSECDVVVLDEADEMVRRTL